MPRVHPRRSNNITTTTAATSSVDSRERVSGSTQPSQSCRRSRPSNLEPLSDGRRRQDSQDAAGQNELRVRQPDKQQVRRQSDVGQRKRGDAEDGGGQLGGGEEVLRPPH
ncbi:hypothetical protein LINGRAPRIM_LOCUS931 [Linum grandiflorum]